MAFATGVSSSDHIRAKLKKQPRSMVLHFGKIHSGVAEVCIQPETTSRVGQLQVRMFELRDTRSSLQRVHGTQSRANTATAGTPRGTVRTAGHVRDTRDCKVSEAGIEYMLA